jgi:predicted transposase YbfD/YdcC
MSGQLMDYFEQVTDPRIEGSQRHKLIDIITITVCGVICGADKWVDIQAFGEAKQGWLKTFLELPNGIASHDTFGEVFARIQPQEFERCFLAWVKAVAVISEGEIVAIDGKTLCGSHDRVLGKGAIHMVSAWASGNRLVLGQVKVADKSNEITAIPALLQVLALKGCIVTIDAMGCQTAIAAQIIQQGADYVLSLKDNQGRLYADVTALFEYARSLRQPP